MSPPLIGVGFEVFGVVQRVFFRKYTQETGRRLGVRGWCKNTQQGTVVGEIQGPPEKVAEMKVWLEKKGSPESRIDKVNFENEHSIDEYTYSDFEIIRVPRS